METLSNSSNIIQRVKSFNNLSNYPNESHFQKFLYMSLTKHFDKNRLRCEVPLYCKNNGGGIVDIAIYPQQYSSTDTIEDSQDTYSSGFYVELKKVFRSKVSLFKFDQYDRQRRKYENITSSKCLLIFPDDIDLLLDCLENQESLLKLRLLF